MPRRLSPGVCLRGGCRRPPAPSLRPHPHGREDARPGEDAPAQLLVSREQPDPGTAARWQEGTVPAAPTALLGRGRRKEGRGPLLWPPARSPRPSRLLPRTAQTTGIRSFSISPAPPFWTPGTPQDPAANQLLASTTMRPTGRNWEELGGFSTLGYDTAEAAVSHSPS